MSKEGFADGCHRWGWLIGIITTVIIQLIAVAFINGQQSQKIHDLQEFFGNRVDRLERQMDEIQRRQP